MPAWLLSILLSLGLPIVKSVVIFGLRRLETAMPGIAPLVEAIINYIQNGGSAAELHQHMAMTVPGFDSKPKA
jgi:hypothetical protein